MTTSETATFTRDAARLVAENDARECAASLERLADLLAVATAA